jgi:hypothetical protein
MEIITALENWTSLIWSLRKAHSHSKNFKWCLVHVVEESLHSKYRVLKHGLGCWIMRKHKGLEIGELEIEYKLLSVRITCPSG